MSDELIIGGKKISNRLFIGTGKFGDDALIPKCIKEASVSLVTVALRRMDVNSIGDNIMKHIPKDCILMPNTHGARNAEEAVRIARLSRAMGCGDFIKIEIISDSKYLLPDNEETIKATEILAKEGFVVMPYINPDLYVAKKLVLAGAASIMPLGAPIGTNKGLKTREMVRILCNEINLPIVVDAGIGTPSQACECMELGVSAVLVNTAIATAKDPVQMAKAFSLAVLAGRCAYLSGIPSTSNFAVGTTPLTGFLR